MLTTRARLALRTAAFLAVTLTAPAGQVPAAAPATGPAGVEQAPLIVEAAAGGYLVRLGPEACLEFDVPRLQGSLPRVSVADPASPASSPGDASAVAWRRVHMRWTLPSAVTQDELAVRFRWLQPPDFWWTPHLAPHPGYVVAQHVFRSPAIVSQRGPLTVTIVPDLDLVGRDEAAPWFLDVDAPAGTGRLGLGRADVAEHVLYRQAPGMVLAPGAVDIAFYVTAYRDPGPVRNPWAQVRRFLWERWARPLAAAGEPVRAPVERYAQRAYDWAFGGWRRSVWQEFQLGGRTVGAPQFIVNVSQSPNYPGEWYQREFLSIWNQAWFSSLRSASGLFRHARRTGDKRLAGMAAMTKELALLAPMADGVFPSVIRTDNVEVATGSGKVTRPQGWEKAYWTNSDRSPDNHGIGSDWYHVLDMSWTGLLMLRWHAELEADQRLLDYATTYADRLLTLQDADGFFPGWLHPRTHRPGPVMNQTPETSMSVTFLLELARLTGRQSYRAAALRALEAVIRDVVPQGRWEDFETYWSCCLWGNDALGRRVERSGMFKQCTFSMFWTAEALLSAYRATGQERYLAWGRRTLDELSMAQQVWQPPFIHVPALGGFGVMNSDGEWNDSRETLFAELFLDYYRVTGERELFERGAAALRSGFIMMYCPENPAVKAMWEKVHPFFGPADYGFTMENYGHGGRTSAAGEGMGSFTIYDWGNGAAAEAAARIIDHYGQIYIDRPRRRAFGWDMADAERVTGGWRITDRAGAERTLRVVFEDGTSTTLTTGGGAVVVPDRR